MGGGVFVRVWGSESANMLGCIVLLMSFCVVLCLRYVVFCYLRRIKGGGRGLSGGGGCGGLTKGG